MNGPLLPGEHAPSVRAIPSPLPSLAILPPIATPATLDLARMAYLQGMQDAESFDCDLNPFS
jgi:hypothetical protein